MSSLETLLPQQASQTQVQIRKATEADAAALRALHRVAIRTLSRGYYTEGQVDSFLRHVPTLDLALIADRTYFVAEADGQIVACGGWSARAPGYGDALGEALNHGEHGGGTPLIRGMYTHPQWARRGLGRRLLAASEAEAQGAGFLDIALDALLAGVPLYEAADYVPLRHRAARLPDGESLPIVHMHKRFLPSRRMQPAPSHRPTVSLS